MTDTTMNAHFAEIDFRAGAGGKDQSGEFRVARVVERAQAVISRNFLAFFVVYAIAYLPMMLINGWISGAADSGAPNTDTAIFAGIAAVLLGVLNILSQSVVFYGAVQDLRGRPVSLSESLRLGLRRFFPVIGLGICMGFAVGLAMLALVVPGVMLLTAWYVATPACVVEQRGPIESMRRSAELTKGHRWKVFGLIIVLMLVGGIASGLIAGITSSVSEPTMKLVIDMLWNGVWGAVSATVVAVTYYDLRVAKDGPDTQRIADVFA